MIRYKVRTPNPHRHFISFEATFPAQNKNSILLQLAAWRPGRYELGNFSKNIRAWTATDSNGNPLIFKKQNKDLWEVQCSGANEVRIQYEYYASELNAGSTFLDENQLYMNPVNCFFYMPDSIDESYELEFDLAADYQIACGLSKVNQFKLHADDFDELADCPLIASAAIKHLEYIVDGIIYHMWIQGEVKLDEPRLINEFVAFTKSQIKIFGDIPCSEYHFLFHFTPYFLRHGVEHHNSTVIAMGPAADFQSDGLHKDLLGISCHELFHTWNVKNIRPVEMMPYDFTKENYSRLGYVYEGVTTYYGDLLLWRSGAISDQEWFQTVDDRLQTHFDNVGRFNLSVAESSFDTWLDGYSPGIPWRKVSIYNEGFLIAMICDLFIIRQSACNHSLDNVMKEMYETFGKTSKGYSESDYRNLIRKYAGELTDNIFDTLVNGTSDYVDFLNEVFSLSGISMNVSPSPKWTEANLGLFVEELNQKVSVGSIVPDSPADVAGLWQGDEIVAMNGIASYKNMQMLIRMNDAPWKLDVLRKGKLFNLNLNPDGKIWAKRFRLQRIEQPSSSQLNIFEKWKFG